MQVVAHMGDSARQRPTAPDSGQTGYEYDDQGRVTQITDAQGYRTRYEHSASGKVSKRELFETNGDIATMLYDYDAGQTIVTNGLNRQTTFDVDEKWRLIGMTDAMRHQVSFHYNNRNQETARSDPQGHTWTTNYDGFGFPFEKVNAIGECTTLAYDSYRNPTLITRPDGTTETLIWDSAQLTGGGSSGSIAPTKRLLLGRRNALNYLTLYRYDERGQLDEVEVAPGNITRYSYDPHGNRNLVEDAEGNSTVYAYDAAGNVETVFDAFNYPTSFTYDAGNRMQTSTNRWVTPHRMTMTCWAISSARWTRGARCWVTRPNSNTTFSTCPGARWMPWVTRPKRPTTFWAVPSRSGMR